MDSHSVLLVEDDTHTRTRLAAAVEKHPDLSLQAAVGTCAEGHAELERCAPGVLLTDLGLPDGNGLELIRAVRSRQLETQAMVITVFADEKHVVAAIEAGAMGYLLKDASADSIGRSIVDLVAGGSPLSPAIARYFLRRFSADQGDVEPAQVHRPRLTDREREVLGFMVKGSTYAEAARMIGVAESTVTSHIRNIYRKLEVNSRGEAVYEALQLGLVKVDD